MGSSSLYDVLRGVSGITTYPPAVAAGNGVSIAEVLRYVQNEAIEIEHHLHSKEIWFGKAASPDEIDAGNPATLAPYVIDSGNNTWGTAVCILGTADTPFVVGKTYYDPHKMLITYAERTSEPYRIRLAWGDSEAAGIAAGDYSEFMIYPTATIRQAPTNIQTRRVASGTKLWANCWCASNTGTINFFIGIHEYDA